MEVLKMKLKVKYFVDDIDTIEKINNGDWIDLRSAMTIKLHKGEYKVIPLGVGMILPEGYEAHIVPRSSAFKNYGILMTNSVGIIDNSYNGENDMWRFPVYATRDTIINKNDRICQFRLVKNMEHIDIEIVDKLNDSSRGGFGSTGSN